MIKMKLKRGDLVKVTTGKFKGIQGPILNVAREKQRVSIEGMTVKKNVKPSQNEDGGIKDVPAFIHISNVALIDPKNKDKTTRIGYDIKGEKKVRIAKKSKTLITK